MAKQGTLEALLKRDRVIVIGGLITVVVLAWIYILLGAGMGMTAFEMTAMSGPPGKDAAMDMAGGASGEASQIAPGVGGGGVGQAKAMTMAAMQPVAWTPGYAMLMVFMWWIMMVAMMLPSAAPMILLFALVNRKQRDKGSPYVPTSAFALGYVLAWGGFSLIATVLQWGLDHIALLSPMMAASSVALGGGLLIGAGVYQLTPLKHACLRHCRSPLHYLSHHWRKGKDGALIMGLEHGLFCLGCCWVLMGLLFFGGVMNLYWILGLALFILLEKTVPAGHWLGSLSGIGLILWGGALLTAAL